MIDTGPVRIYGNMLPGHEKESYKTFMVSVTDDCTKVIPDALNKYKIKDNYQNYILILCAKGKEVCLSYDQKPLEIAQKHIPIDEIPEFVIKHVKVPSGQVLPREGSIETLKSSEIGVQMAVAIYGYAAHRDDELNVSVGDHFKVIKREAGWVIAENEEGKQGWVPDGCLEDSKGPDLMLGQPQKGLVLADYEKSSPSELDIIKGDVVVIHQHFQHWLLVDCNGTQGWVPACYISIDQDRPLPSPVSESSKENDIELKVFWIKVAKIIHTSFSDSI